MHKKAFIKFVLPSKSWKKIGCHSRFNPECYTERGCIDSLYIALGMYPCRSHAAEVMLVLTFALKCLSCMHSMLSKIWIKGWILNPNTTVVQSYHIVYFKILLNTYISISVIFYTTDHHGHFITMTSVVAFWGELGVYFCLKISFRIFFFIDCQIKKIFKRVVINWASLWKTKCFKIFYLPKLVRFQRVIILDP